ncbi:MAG TPA: hypothetical protein VFT74_16450 [Isosphaeraceae bacterium]|nr:hypothetical protein [Isosphaeraceae bacterium]
MSKFNGKALVFGQSSEGQRESGQRLGLLHGMRGIVGGVDRKRFEPNGGGDEVGFDRSTEGVLFSVESPVRQGNLTGEDGAEPGDEFGLYMPAELLQVGVGREEGLLGEIRRIDLAFELRAEMEPGQKSEILPVVLRVAHPALNASIHVE